jgi:hypothetical protein
MLGGSLTQRVEQGCVGHGVGQLGNPEVQGEQGHRDREHTV